MDFNRPAHVIMQEDLALGLIPAFIPVRKPDGKNGLYTIGGFLNKPLRTEADGLAAAILAIFHAHEEAEKAGFDPLY